MDPLHHQQIAGLGHDIIGLTAAVPPLVLASPHSGRDYPAAFLARSRLTLGQLRRAEDAHVADLLRGAVACGVPLLRARLGRAFVDLNRAEDELDPAMFTEALPRSPGQASERVAAGLGVLPRVVAQGMDIYATRLPAAEARYRIEQVHRPYHAALSALVERARCRHGHAVLIDCHSMPAPPPGPTGLAPQAVIGDLRGTSCAPGLTAAVEAYLLRAGWRVARNDPYAGGHTTQRHMAPGAGIHVLQLEVDRALYMDPVRLQPHAGFARVAQTLAGLMRHLLEVIPHLGLAPPLREAAE